MQQAKTEVDYLVLYGKTRQKVRALESQLERLINRHSLEVEMLKAELNSPQHKAIFAKKELINDLLLEVCKATNTTAGQLMSPSRDRNIVTARHLFFYIARHEYNINWAKMTRLLDRHHTSGMHGAAQYANYLNLGYGLETKLYKMVMEAMQNND
jgi:chromosomal replication initiation ATPase DnaA